MVSRNESEVGFRLQQSRNRRHPATFMINNITDTNFADDLALISETIEQAQLFLLRVENCAAQVGLHANADKTKYMTYNLEDSYLKSLSGADIEHVDDFLYLGSWVDTSEKDLNTRIAKAWSAMSKMEVIWKTNLERKLKINFFRATVETVLLYGCTTWTLTKALERKLDGTYARLIRTALNIKWQTHTTNAVLYGNLPRITTTIKNRRLKFAGHCFRSKDEVVQPLIMWEPRHGKRRRGRPAKTFIDQLMDDTEITKEDLPGAMNAREIWRQVVHGVRPRMLR